MATICSGVYCGYITISYRHDLYMNITGDIAHNGNTVTLSNLSCYLYMNEGSVSYQSASRTWGLKNSDKSVVNTTTVSYTGTWSSRTFSLPNMSFPLSATSTSTTMYITGPDGDFSFTLSSIPQGTTPPTGLALQNVVAYSDGFSADVKVATWGNPSDSASRYYELGVMNHNSYGSPYAIKWGTVGATAGVWENITVTNSSKEAGSDLTIVPNTSYYLGVFATNNTSSASTVIGLYTTMVGSLTSCTLGSLYSASSGVYAEISWSRASDGGALPRNIEYRYSTDGGSTYTDWALGTGASELSGTFDISGLPFSTAITLEVALTTEAGRSSANTFTFTTPAQPEPRFTPGNLYLGWSSTEWAGLNGKAALTENEKDIIGVVRIANSGDKAINGAVRVSISSSKNITGSVRINGYAEKTISGAVFIANENNTDITGNTFIEVVASNTIDGKVRIEKSSTKDIAGSVDISKTSTKDISGAVMIAGSRTYDITGTVFIDNPGQRVVDKDITGVVDILNSNSKEINGSVMVAIANDTTISGTVMIAKELYSNLNGQVRISGNYTKDINGRVNVQIVSSKTINGQTFVQIQNDTEIEGGVNVMKAQSKTISGLIRIETKSQKDITGAVRIRETSPEKLPETWIGPTAPEPEDWDKEDKEPETWEYDDEDTTEEWASIEKNADEWSEAEGEEETWHYPIEERN